MFGNYLIFKILGLMTLVAESSGLSFRGFFFGGGFCDAVFRGGVRILVWTEVLFEVRLRVSSKLKFVRSGESSWKSSLVSWALLYS